MFGGPHRTLVARIYSFIDKFKRPPEDHLPDICSDILEGNNAREAALYAEIIEQIHAAKATVNAEYAMATLGTFIKRQSLRSIAVDLTKALQRDTEASLEEAEQLLASANRSTLTVFDPGVRLSDKRRALQFLDISSASMPTGIPELDRRGFGPARGELWLGVANTKMGKSWFLSQLGKVSLMQRLRVSHISLEMSEARCSQRYMQALFAISKRKEPHQTVRFKRDESGVVYGLNDVQVTPKLALDDPHIRSKLEAKIDRWGHRLLDNIIVKQFPTGQLTINQLKAYLDNLESAEHFIPDLLIVDYPDLMRIDKESYRLSLDEIYKDLRGIAVARNIAVAIVSQSHRAAAKAKQVGAENVAESYAKIANCDTVITFSSTTQEQKLGLARLHVAAGRNDQDKLTVIITQNYGMGQFALDSMLMSGNDYWSMIGSEDEA